MEPTAGGLVVASGVADIFTLSAMTLKVVLRLLCFRATPKLSGPRGNGESSCSRLPIFNSDQNFDAELKQDELGEQPRKKGDVEEQKQRPPES